MRSQGDWAVTHDDENCAGTADQCGCGAYDTGDVVTYAPDLDHTNTGVQSAVKDYLSFLKNKGYTGFRFDMVKGYSGSYINTYVSASNPEFSVGEYWDSSVTNVSRYRILTFPVVTFAGLNSRGVGGELDQGNRQYKPSI